MSGRVHPALRAFADPEARWSTTLILSFTLHAASFFLVLVLPRLLPSAAAAPPVYVVDLVSIPAGAPAPAPAAGGGGARPAAPPKKPEKEKAIKIPDRATPKPAARPTPAPKKPETRTAPEVKPTPPPRKTPPPAAGTAEAPPDATATAAGAGAPASAPGVPGAAGAQTGGAGAGLADAFSAYGFDLKRRIDAAWSKPLRTGDAARRRMVVVVRLNLSSTGRVLGSDLVEPSGYDALDRSVLQAIRDAQPFPSFPVELGSAPRMWEVEFELNPE
jgi:TonB family protein